MLGDFVRGRQVIARFGPEVGRGIRLHRHIDSFTDALDGIVDLRTTLPAPFRRYAGIIIDLAFDHELAKHWGRYSADSLEDFDLAIRLMLVRHDQILPVRLRRFMAYADRRGLFAAYREEAEILRSLTGIGKRLSRPNPLHRVGEIWGNFRPLVSAAFQPVYEEVQSEVSAWLKAESPQAGR